MKRFFTVTTKDGLYQQTPFKPWFRQTQGIEDTRGMTSHQMRDYMKKKGWEIRETPGKVLIIEPGSEVTAEMLEEDESPAASDSAEASAESSLFALESHLRDYLAKNLNTNMRFDKPLELVDVEYATDVGPIDILAKNADNEYFVFELKLQRGVDAALGQLLRYMGWCTKHLDAKKVHGIILAADISEKLRYAANQVPSVTLHEYELQMKIRAVEKIG